MENLCSAELFGYKFIVPCNPDRVLSINYGKKWIDPVGNKEYKIHNRNQSTAIIRKLYELPYSFRYYLKNGTIDVIPSLEKINKLYVRYTNGFKLDYLPNDDY